jgi:tRNA pseudouridine13 synthase
MNADELLSACRAPRPTSSPTLGRALMRARADDFQVVERPAFTPSGSGEHLLIRARKRDANSDWVAGQLARWAQVPRSAVGYAGRKDRHAVAEQWFSVHLPGRVNPDTDTFAATGVEILETARHHRKVQRGALRGNAFLITLRELECDPVTADTALESLAARGFPNYFGDQRFGRGAGNLLAWLQPAGARRTKRHQQGLMLSAARSFLFNQVLASRVHDGTWERPLQGDVLALEGTHRWFTQETPPDQTLETRVAQLDVHPTGPLWGKATPPSSGAVRQLENAVVAPYEALCRPLEAAGLRQERRALRARARDLQWRWLEPRVLQLAFELPRGSFATALLANLWRIDEPGDLNAVDGT